MLTNMANLALTYRLQRQWKESKKLGVHVMEMEKKILGQEYLDTLNSIANLQSTYQNQGRWKEVKKLEVQIIEIKNKVLR